MGDRRKTSTDVEGALAVKKTTKQKKGCKKVEGARAVNKATKQKQKKRSEKKQMENMIKSLKETNETLIKLLKANSGWTEMAKADLQETSLKEKETRKIKVGSRYECCYETEDSKGRNMGALFVKGFDTSLDRDDIKSALFKHFGSCGEITRVFVPFECQTGASLGFAFIDLEDEKKALTLSGSYMGGCKLEVIMARHMVEYIGSNFSGCDRCRQASMKASFNRFYKKHRAPPGFESPYQR